VCRIALCASASVCRLARSSPTHGNPRVTSRAGPVTVVVCCANNDNQRHLLSALRGGHSACQKPDFSQAVETRGDSEGEDVEGEGKGGKEAGGSSDGSKHRRAEKSLEGSSSGGQLPGPANLIKNALGAPKVERKKRTQLSIPLENADPLNVQYLTSRAYFRLLANYGLEPNPARSNDQAAGSGSGDLKVFGAVGSTTPAVAGSGSAEGQLSREEDEKLRFKLMTEIRARRSLLCPPHAFRAVVNALCGSDARLLDDVLTQLTKPLSEPAPARESGALLADHELKQHSLGLFFRLFDALSNPSAKFAHLQGVQKGLFKARKRSLELRASILKDFAAISAGLARSPVAMISKQVRRRLHLRHHPRAVIRSFFLKQEEAEARRKLSEAGSRLDKKAAELQLQKTQQSINQQHEELALLNTLQQAVISGVTTLFADPSRPFDGQHVEATLQWLHDLTDDSHRGVSFAARSGLVATAKVRLHGADPSKRDREVQSTVDAIAGKLHGQLKDPVKAAALRRRKGDALALLSQIAPLCTSADLRANLVPLLVSSWDDRSPYIVSLAVDSVLALRPEVFPEMHSFIAPSSGSASAFLLSNVVSRVQAADYAHAELLNKVTQAYFV
jgi:hypothetical protein